MTEFGVAGDQSIDCHDVSPNGEDVVYRSRFDLDEAGSVTLAVLDAVATATDTEPEQLPRLASYVDPDALNGFFQTSDSVPVRGTRLTFPFAGYSVTVTGDQFIILRSLK